MIAVFEVLFPAVDRDEAGAAFGQQPHGRGADDAGSAGDDGDPAVQANSIGHVGVSPVAPVAPDVLVVRRGACATLIEPTISFVAGADQ